MNKKVLGLAFFIFIILAIAIGLAIRSNILEEQAQTRTIGAVLPLTGELALFGQWLREGAQLASEEASVDLKLEDNKNSTKESVTAFQRLVSLQQCQGILSARTPTAFALAPIARAAKMPLVMTFADLPSEKNPYVFNYHFPTIDEISVLASYAENSASRITIITVNDEYGRLAKDLFKKKFQNSVIHSDDLPVSGENVRSLVAKIPIDTDMIFLVAYEQNFVAFIRELVTQGREVPVIGPNTLTVFLHLLDFDLTFPLLVTMSRFDAFPEEENAEKTDFMSAFQKRYGRPPNMVNAEAYGATRFLISDTIMEFKNEETQEIPSIFGPASLENNGQFHFPLAVVRIDPNRERSVVYEWNP